MSVKQQNRQNCLVLKVDAINKFQIFHEVLDRWLWHVNTNKLNQGLSKHQEVRFTPVTKITKLIVVFWDLSSAIKKLILEDKYQTDHKKIDQQCTSSNKRDINFSKLFFQFLGEISLKFEMCSFFSGSKQKEKQLLREIENYISHRMCLANENFILVFDVTFFQLLQIMFHQKMQI